MNDDFLTRFHKPPRREFAAALYQRISRPMSKSPHVSYRQRLVLAFAALVVIFTVVLVASPSTRVLAADLLRQIGVLFLSDRPFGEPVLIASPAPEQLALADATSTPINPASQVGTPLEVAIAQAGFKPYLPSYLPAGYTQTDVVAAEYVDDYRISYGMGIFVTYCSAAGGYLAIQTTRFDGRAQDVPTGGHTLTDVSVAGQPGVWVEDLPFQASQSSSATIDMLLWQQGDFLLAVQSDQLPLAEVLKIAEALKQ